MSAERKPLAPRLPERDDEPLFADAFPFQDDVPALPVTDLDQASAYYCRALGMTEAEE